MVAQQCSHRQYKHPVKQGRVTVLGEVRLLGGYLAEKSILRQAQIRRK